MRGRIRTHHVRRTLDLVLVALVVVVVALAVASRVGPMLSWHLLAVRGGSMEPAIPLGALIVVDEAGSNHIGVGDVISFRTSNGPLMTHRVIRIADVPSGRWYETKGDANLHPDPVLVPATSVVGPVRFSVPALGLIVAMLSAPIGIFSLLSIMGTLLTASLLLDEIAPSRSARRVGPARRSWPPA
ncbi:MAG: signal peptidase I [Chloroflexota bacterium]|nr:signal peptidase I [Chloroflexota bacterium]